MSDEEKVQTLAAELRVMESYYNEISTRENLLTRVIAESRAASEAVKNLSQTNSSEILIPIGGGVSIHGQAPPPESMIVSIGADVVIEKTREGTLTFLEERIHEIEKALLNLEAQRADLGGRINTIRMEINKLIEKLKPG